MQLRPRNSKQQLGHSYPQNPYTHTKGSYHHGSPEGQTLRDDKKETVQNACDHSHQQNALLQVQTISSNCRKISSLCEHQQSAMSTTNQYTIAPSTLFVTSSTEYGGTLPSTTARQQQGKYTTTTSARSKKKEGANQIIAANKT